VEVFVYAINPNNGSPWRNKIEGVSEHFIDINAMSQRQAAERIRADNIDVLVNLNGYTLTARNGAIYWVVDSQFARIRKLNGFARIRPRYARLLVRIALILTASPAARIRNSHWFAN
jgi:hypothetical protein